MSSISEETYHMIDFENVIKIEGINRDIADLIDFETVINAKELNQSELKQSIKNAKYCSECLQLKIKHFKCIECPLTPNQFKRRDKKIKALKVKKNYSFQCTECDKGFETMLRLSNHKSRTHNVGNISVNKTSRCIKESLQNLSKNYTTQLAVKDELKLNIPNNSNNLRTYSRKKPPVLLKIKEEPEFILPD